MPVVAPASAVPRFKNKYYKSEFLFALADALHEEYAAIVAAGLFLQVDDVFLPYVYDVAFADQPLEHYKKWAALRIEALNHALRGFRPGAVHESRPSHDHLGEVLAEGARLTTKQLWGK